MNRNCLSYRNSLYARASARAWFSPAIALLAVGLASIASNAQATNISHTSIIGGSSSFTSADGQLTLTPFAAGGGAGVFGSTSGCCIGVGGGANGSGIDDVDGNPATTADRERMDISLAGDAVLSNIGFIFTRANGPLPTDGIAISGFLSNPGASLDPAAAAAGITATYNGGTLYVNHGWRGGAVSVLSFSHAGATRGQTLSLGSNDSNESKPQVVINNLTYDVVPEPSTLMLAGLATSLITMRRR
jgi:hypothetical protein